MTEEEFERFKYPGKLSTPSIDLKGIDSKVLEGLMTAEQKMLNVLAQVRAVDDGKTNVITCPYCGKMNRENVPFCCQLFADASTAALERIRWEQAKEVAERALERHSQN